jgi:hypothetical protein
MCIWSNRKPAFTRWGAHAKGIHDRGGDEVANTVRRTTRRRRDRRTGQRRSSNMTGDGPKIQPRTWVIDPVHSSIIFSVRHLMVATVRGRFGAVNCTIRVGPEMIRR